jgi:hypothetical protein
VLLPSLSVLKAEAGSDREILVHRHAPGALVLLVPLIHQAARSLPRLDACLFQSGVPGTGYALGHAEHDELAASDELPVMERLSVILAAKHFPPIEARINRAEALGATAVGVIRDIAARRSSPGFRRAV